MQMVRFCPLARHQNESFILFVSFVRHERSIRFVIFFCQQHMLYISIVIVGFGVNDTLRVWHVVYVYVARHLINDFVVLWPVYF